MASLPESIRDEFKTWYDNQAWYEVVGQDEPRWLRLMDKVKSLVHRLKSIELPQPAKAHYADAGQLLDEEYHHEGAIGAVASNSQETEEVFKPQQIV